jgi:hypothetical protein
LSNLENSLKSGEGGIVTIDHLPGLLDGPRSLMRALATPILLLVVLLAQRNDRNSPTV